MVGKVVGVWMNDKELKKADDWLAQQNKKLQPAKLYLSTAMKELLFKYIEKQEEEDGKSRAK